MEREGGESGIDRYPGNDGGSEEIIGIKRTIKMEEKETIMECLAELLETYYNGSFSQMTCDYIRSSEMTPEEVEELLEAMRENENSKRG